jgi:hypothetical protein
VRHRGLIVVKQHPFAARGVASRVVVVVIVVVVVVRRAARRRAVRILSERLSPAAREFPRERRAEFAQFFRPSPQALSSSSSRRVVSRSGFNFKFVSSCRGAASPHLAIVRHAQIDAKGVDVERARARRGHRDATRGRARSGASVTSRLIFESSSLAAATPRRRRGDARRRGGSFERDRGAIRK